VVELRTRSGNLCELTTTDASGNYTFASVLPGHYYARAGATRFRDQWHSAAQRRTGAVPYSVPPGSAIGGLNFDLDSGRTPALVEVTSDPSGAAVYLDYQPTTNVTPVILDVGEVVNGQETGETCSTEGREWPPGSGNYVAVNVWRGHRIATHVITVKKPGRPRPSPQPVAAREAETTRLHFDLTSAASGAVSVATTPAGATVYLDYADSSAGVSPVVIGSLAPGTHVVLLTRAEHLQPPPVLAYVHEGGVTDVAVPLQTNSSPDRFIAEVSSMPTGAVIYVDYLPATDVTDAVIDWIEPVSHEAISHAAIGWRCTSHTIMVRKNGFLPRAARYLGDHVNEPQAILIHLVCDSVTAVDDDHDGLPDQWEDAYRLRELAPGQHGPNDDPDNDGVPNKDEMGAGTNPLDGNSCLSVTDLAVSTPGPGQTVTFIFDTVPGRTYIVQCTHELKSGWTNLSGLILATDYQTAYTTQIPEGSAHQFYRLIVLTP
jgi:hypothetical protein